LLTSNVHFAGQSFNTPEAVLTRSSECLGGLSRCIHRLFLDRLLPRNWSDAEPPVLLNTWETLYFDVNHQDIVAMAEDVSMPSLYAHEWLILTRPSH
jgi:alpha-galactosidase